MKRTANLHTNDKYEIPSSLQILYMVKTKEKTKRNGKEKIKEIMSLLNQSQHVYIYTHTHTQTQKK